MCQGVGGCHARFLSLTSGLISVKSRVYSVASVLRFLLIIISRLLLEMFKLLLLRLLYFFPLSKHDILFHLTLLFCNNDALFILRMEFEFTNTHVCAYFHMI